MYVALSNVCSTNNVKSLIPEYEKAFALGKHLRCRLLGTVSVTQVVHRNAGKQVRAERECTYWKWKWQVVLPWSMLM